MYFPAGNTNKTYKSRQNKIGGISKAISDNVNKELRQKANCNQWMNSKVVEWFMSIPSKSQHKFIMFDIKDFYPSIKQDLLSKALNFAKQHTAISKSDYDIILHCKEIFTLYQGDPWTKKKVEYLMSPWVPMMVLKYVNYWDMLVKTCI